MTHRTPSGRFTGLKPLNHDPRDIPYIAGTHARLMGPQPDVTDNLAGLAMPAIFDQQTEGSCVANAVTRFHYWLSLRLPQYFPAFQPLSRQALYYWGRSLPWNNEVEQDSGLNSRDGFIVMQKIGIPPEADDPYQYSTLFTDPGDKAVQDAAPNRIGQYNRIGTVEDLQGLLINRWTGTMGIALYESFEDVGEDGIYNPDPSREKIIGLHELYIRDHDARTNNGSAWADNSWGASWGKQGSCAIPYSHLNDYASSRWDSFTGSPIYQPATSVST